MDLVQKPSRLPSSARRAARLKHRLDPLRVTPRRPVEDQKAGRLEHEHGRSPSNLACFRELSVRVVPDVREPLSASINEFWVLARANHHHEHGISKCERRACELIEHVVACWTGRRNENDGSPGCLSGEAIGDERRESFRDGFLVVAQFRWSQYQPLKRVHVRTREDEFADESGHEDGGEDE